MSTDPNELARNLRDKLANRDEHISPAEGRIVTGVVSTGDMSVRAGSQPQRAVMQRPPPSPLEVLFEGEDPPNTKYYVAPSGVCNTVRADGTRIEFVKGVYKTNNKEDQELLDQLCKRKFIQEILPPEPAPSNEE